MPIEKLIDTHVHLDMIPDAPGAVERARAAHITGIVAVGMNIGSNEKTLELAEQFPETVYPAIGYHPWAIKEKDIDDTISFVEARLKDCIALGEVGLDYKIKVKKRVQQEVFQSLLDLAATCRKPVNVHSRYSFERAHVMLRQAGIEKAVFHWYAGPLDILDRILDSGYCISATPALAYSTRHRAAIERAPMDRILIETDAPEQYQDEVSEPAFLLKTLDELAKLKNLPKEEVAVVVTKNAELFYGIKGKKR